MRERLKKIKKIISRGLNIRVDFQLFLQALFTLAFFLNKFIIFTKKKKNKGKQKKKKREKGKKNQRK